MTPLELSIRFFLQLAFILVVCRLTGMALRFLGQSQVVSEMIAGVLMGPSLLGWLAPDFSAYLFPPASKPVIFAICQVGLVLYMFLVGLEFDLGLIRSRARGAASVSVAGIAAPFALGGAIAYLTHGDGVLFASTTGVNEAMLFMGAAMSITAFPTLARILEEQGLTRTSLGTLVLAAGSIDDAVAWCVLAIVLSSFQKDPTIAAWAIGGGVLYALVTLLVVRPLLRPLGALVERKQSLSEGGFTLVLALVMLGAFITDHIQIYAVFGAFVMGCAMPRGRLQVELDRRIMPLTRSLLVPLFFVYSGLNTKIGVVDTPYLWFIAAVCLLAAIVGKGAACYAAARSTGEPPREALAVGTLMNARGLMELIILNIGLERGVIQPPLFAVMVLMAIVTTLMATPIVRVLYGKPGELSPALSPLPAE